MAGIVVSTLDRNTQRTQKIHILRRESHAILRCLACVRARLYHFIQSDGRLQHQENVKTLAADILNDTRDLLRFGNTLMNRFAELLHEFAQILVQNPLTP